MAESLADFLLKEAPKVPHIIGRGILPVAGKMVIGGPPKSNKSFVVINMMLDLVRGHNIFDAAYPTGSPVFPVSKSHRVLYFENEIGHDGLKERLLGITNGEIPLGLELFIQSRDLTLRLDTPEGVQAISEQVAAVKPDVVVIDPLAKFHLADENSAQEMGAIMRVGDRLIEKFGCALVYIHHTGKEDINNPRRGGNRLRGSSAIFADVDTFIEVVRQSDPADMEPILGLNFEIRRGKPINPVYVRRLESGRIKYIEDNFNGFSMKQEKPFVFPAEKPMKKSSKQKFVDNL